MPISPRNLVLVVVEVAIPPVRDVKHFGYIIRNRGFLCDYTDWIIHCDYSLCLYSCCCMGQASACCPTFGALSLCALSIACAFSCTGELGTTTFEV